jgi:hypothetical protein
MSWLIRAHHPQEPIVPSTKTSFAATKRTPKKTRAADVGRPPSELIDRRIAELRDWRGDLLARLRSVIGSADPGVIEE